MTWGVSYPTAWFVHHKLMQAMVQRKHDYVLCGNVQVDDAYLGAIAYPFNRRFDLRALPGQLLTAAVVCGPCPQRQIRFARAC